MFWLILALMFPFVLAFCFALVVLFKRRPRVDDYDEDTDAFIPIMWTSNANSFSPS
jgi:hypothetical protein